mmetsp:Transcript_38411/g.80431  ORF Transcript_38411/g.80431 Transcript_38411/m.80431 type:complete len:235 (+) Transcript_38411:133-837(+)
MQGWSDQRLVRLPLVHAQDQYIQERVLCNDLAQLLATAIDTVDVHNKVTLSYLPLLVATIPLADEPAIQHVPHLEDTAIPLKAHRGSLHAKPSEARALLQVDAKLRSGRGGNIHLARGRGRLQWARGRHARILAAGHLLLFRRQFWLNVVTEVSLHFLQHGGDIQHGGERSGAHVTHSGQQRGWWLLALGPLLQHFGRRHRQQPLRVSSGRLCLRRGAGCSRSARTLVSHRWHN